MKIVRFLHYYKLIKGTNYQMKLTYLKDVNKNNYQRENKNSNQISLVNKPSEMKTLGINKNKSKNESNFSSQISER